MPDITLHCQQSQATIDSKYGALVTNLSLQDQHQCAHTILWNRTIPLLPDDPPQWPTGGIPFLFPFAGRVWHQGQLHRYALGAQSFSMPIHGFGWSKTWQTIQTTPNLAKLRLTSDADTLEHYPFHFAVDLTITLASHSLLIHCDVQHLECVYPEISKMPFALGWHPYFATKNLRQVAIPSQTVNTVTELGDAGPTFSCQDFLGTQPWLPQEPKLSSLIFSHPEHGIYHLTGEEPQNHSFKINVSSGPLEVMQRVVTWTNKPRDFLCIEPWMSLPNAVLRSSECAWLAAGETRSAWFKIECM